MIAGEEDISSYRRRMPDRVRSLNEIVSMNARLAIEFAKKEAALEGRNMSRKQIAEAMARRLPRHKPESIYRTLSHLLKTPPRRYWRIDYLEAFALAVGIPADLLLRTTARFDRFHS